MSLARESRSSSDHGMPDAFAPEGKTAAGSSRANHDAADAAAKRMAKSGSSSDGSPVAPGNEIWVHRKEGFHHAGVYVGNDSVIQVSGDPITFAEGLLHGTRNTKIISTTVAQFADGDPMSAGPDKPAFSVDQVIERAKARIGETWAYDPVDHNCQTFASDVVTGHGYSPEGIAFKNLVPNLAGSAAHGIESAASGAAHGVAGAASSAAHKLGKLF